MQMCDGARVKKLVHQLADTTCSVLLIPDVFTFNILHSRLEEMNGVPVVPLYDTPLSGVNRLLKRAEEHCAGDADLAADLPGAVLYCAGGETQFTRAGYFPPDSLWHGWQADQSVEVPFHESDGERQSGDSGDAEQSARHQSGEASARTSLDELPQFINVLTGGMSIVGPRPHAVAHNEQYRQLIEGYMLRHKVKPGITGWAQINGWRGETDTLEKMEKRVEFDLEYIPRMECLVRYQNRFPDGIQRLR